MEIIELIDHLEELVVEARRLPVGGNLVIDRKRLLDIVDQLRLAIPADIRQATQVLERQTQITQEANQQAARMINGAEQSREQMLLESSVYKEAEDRGQRVIMDAQAKARQTIAEADTIAAAHLSEAAEAASGQLSDADAYARDVFRRLQEQIEATLHAVAQSAKNLEEKR